VQAQEEENEPTEAAAEDTAGETTS
jgi:hypothetical protein